MSSIVRDHAMNVDPRWSASRLARLIESEVNRRTRSAGDATRCTANDVATREPDEHPHLGRRTLDELLLPDHYEFVDNAYRMLLGRPPRADEHVAMLTALLNGDSKTWLLGSLRYGREGRLRALEIEGLRHRYLAHKLFRIPGLGPVFEWMGAIWQLPRSIRYFRALSQAAAGNALDMEQQLRGLVADRFRDDVREATASSDEGAARLERRYDALIDRFEGLEQYQATIAGRLDETQSRLASIFPGPLGEMLEIEERSLLDLARQRAGISPGVPTSALPVHERYALFEMAFYDPDLVAAKQRIYLPYLDRKLVERHPFLDLGCGRGEFLQILRDAGIAAVGVDANPTGLNPLRDAGFHVVEKDLLEFLETDVNAYSGASALQVAEHLTSDQIERMLALVAARLPSGAPLIVETPNPLSPFALGQFHTDPTHVAPLPPERLRFAIEAAGFERSRTLFQSRVPGNPFMGPDARAYYMDYAIIAYRSAG